MLCVQGQLVRIFEFGFDIIEIILKIELVKIDRKDFKYTYYEPGFHN